MQLTTAQCWFNFYIIIIKNLQFLQRNIMAKLKVNAIIDRNVKKSKNPIENFLTMWWVLHNDFTQNGS